MWGQDWGSMFWGAAAAVPVLGPLGWLVLGASMGGTGVLFRKRLAGTSATTRIGLALLVATVLPLVAFGQVALPNVFTNGTVADANEVNANFDAILEETGRYHATLVATGSPLAIPAPVTQQLCEDLDGCEILLVNFDSNGGGVPVFSSATPHRMFIHHTAPFYYWSMPGNGREGEDADGTEKAVTFDPSIVCVFSDGNFTLPLGSRDLTEGYFLFSTIPDPNTECRLTIID